MHVNSQSWVKYKDVASKIFNVFFNFVFHIFIMNFVFFMTLTNDITTKQSIWDSRWEVFTTCVYYNSFS